ncbi:MAG: hypothetical protein Q9167_005683 [Letrouitia subvulpina]
MDSNHLLSEDPFQNRDTQRLFEAIDQLRSHGLNHDLDLPELVIVGDQSVGKSSLLQSLTDIPFPVAGRLCTRFPTRIVSRRTPNESERTKISIERYGFSYRGPLVSNEKLLERYSAFTRSSPSISATEFKAIIDEAKSVMGISSSANRSDASSSSGDHNFSKDVLKVEISGPDRSYFSILDVPGIFQSVTHDITTKEKDDVREMVTSYMAPEQSVIICVADGTYEVANQAAFEMTKEHDPERKRTVGVVTKCDVTQDVTEVLELAQNAEIPLLHGWFFVRNRTPKELERGLTSRERHQIEEKFFSQEPWNRLSKDHRGTQALKKYLAHLLCERIQESFPSMLSTIETRQISEQNRLDECGNSRQTLEQKRTYLTSIAQKFHNLAEKVLWGRYDSISSNDVKLRRQIREENDSFTIEMTLNGHCVAFVDLLDSENHKLTDRNDDSSGSFSKLPPVGLDIPHTKTYWWKYREKDTHSSWIDFQNVCCVEPWSSYSFEELRLRDNIQVSPPPSVRGNGFGHTDRPTTTAGSTMPSSAHKPLNVEQSSTGGPFGSQGVTQPSSSTSLFGKPTATSTAQSTSPGSLFSSGTKPGADATAQPSSGSGLFSTSQSSSSSGAPFGAKTSQNATTQPSSGSGLFSTNQSTSSNRSPFGATASQNATTQPSSSGNLFSTNQSTSSNDNLFGVKSGLNATTKPSSSGNLFSTNQSTSSIGNVFGIKPGSNTTNTTQPSSGSGGLFGTNPGLNASSTTQPSSGGSLFSSTQKTDSNNLSQPSNSSVFGQSSKPSSHQTNKPSSGEYSNVQATRSSQWPSNAGENPGALFGGEQQAKEVANSRSSDIYTWIREVITNCRGTELQGTLNPDVLPTLFHNQICKWQGISEQHFQKVTARTLSTLLLLVDMSCKEVKTRKKIYHALRKANETATKRGMAQIARRISDLSAGHLQTQNQIFEQKLRKARLLRFAGALKRYQASQKPKNDGTGFGGGGSGGTSGFGQKPATDGDIVIEMRDIPSLFDELHMGNAQNLEDEIHDTLQAYYELARNDFVEYVTQLVVEPYLKDPQGPVLCFSPVSVGSLSDGELEDFAAEDEKLVRERAQAEETLARLKKAEEIAARYI